MAKRTAKRAKKTAKPSRRTGKPKRSVKRPAKRSAKRQKPALKRRKRAAPPAKTPHLDRARRTLADPGTIPSSLDLDRRSSAARSGRAGMLRSRKEHGSMNAVTVGDVDVDAQDAYFTGEEAPGGDNPTPGSDVVDDIGTALGVHYDNAEELKSVEKVEKRDKHRWELDPASAEDFKERK
jgi:uncharacterized protein DUF6335